MTLLVDELYPDIVFEQKFRIKKSISMPHIRPWLYKQGTLVDGDLTLDILQDGNLLKTAIIPFTTLNTELNATYNHGQVRFDFDPLQLNHDRKAEFTEYTIRLYMDNHTLDENNFVGTVRRYEQKFYDTYGDGVEDNEAPNDLVEPLGFELFRWSY